MLKKNLGKLTLAVLLAAAFVLSTQAMTVYGAEKGKACDDPVIYTAAAEEDDGNVRLLNGVTREMCNADFWADRTYRDADELLMTHEEIDDWNYMAMHTEAANMIEITNPEYFPETYNASTKIANRLKDPFKDSGYTLYVNGNSYPYNDGVNEYVSGITSQIGETAYTSTTQKREYAVCVHRTNLRNLPTTDKIGYSADDCDDENAIDAIELGEPLVVIQRCEIDGHPYYFCATMDLYGWVDGEDMAICKDREEWLGAWNFDSDARDFLVVTQDRIILEKSGVTPYSSELSLMMGTKLRLVPEEDIPATVGERGTMYNYVVYVPTRDENGKYEAKMALISMHCDVNIGYVDYTQRNLLRLAFQFLGDRYGWGGCDDAMDCSMYNQIIYRCFGFEMPRNTTYQGAVTDGAIDVSAMDVAEKQVLLEKIPVGSMLYFTGHTMIYVGEYNGTGYVINDVGSLCETDDESLEVLTAYSVCLNPLTVRRSAARGGKTWIEYLNKFVVPASAKVLSDEELEKIKQERNISKGTVTLKSKSLAYTGKARTTAVTVRTKSGKLLSKGEDYAVAYSNNIKVGKATAVVNGLDIYSGTKKVSYKIVPATPKVSSLTSGKRRITVKLGAAVSSTGGSHYEIQYRIKGKTSWKSVTTSSQSKTIRNLTKGKSYHVRVRAYKMVDGEKYSGAWTEVKVAKSE